MTEAEVGSILVTLGVIIALAHLLGHVFDRLRQPRLIGEILAGVIVGPYVLGELAPSVFTNFFAFGTDAEGPTKTALSFVYWLGVFLLMFLSGSQVRQLLSREHRRPTLFLLGIGKTLPFAIVLLLGALSLLPLHSIAGVNGAPLPSILILACAVAVTSIPVISRIFQDLGIMKSRFASLILGIAVIEDILLWGIVAIATSYATTTHESASSTAVHVAINLGFLFLGLLLFPRLVAFVRQWRWNMLYKASPIAFAMVVLSFYIGVASALQVNLVFAAFLAGFGLVGGASGSQRKYFTDPLEVISKFSFAILIPVYFAVIGYRLVFNDEFSIVMFLLFLVGSSLLAMGSVSFAARLAGYNKLDIANIAITLNARGGPGIVLASVAYEAGIINAGFYTTLVLAALLTSQFAGSWLQYVLRKKLPLLSR